MQWLLTKTYVLSDHLIYNGFGSSDWNEVQKANLSLMILLIQ